MNVLVLNVGSSSLKFELVATDAEAMASDGDRRLAGGAIEHIGGAAVVTVQDAAALTRHTALLRDIPAAVDWLLHWLVAPETETGIGGLADIHAVGHRVVHGGEAFHASVLVDDAVLQRLEERTIELAPLHNPYNIRGIRAVRALLGATTPQAAVFDTAFHQTLPEHAFLYAIPYSIYRRHRIRRYGFHGTSHRYVAWRYRRLTGRTREDTHLVSLHLGNGCSACAIRGGNSVDISMGFTPLEGLVMGTRSGDVDPAVVSWLAGKEGWSAAEVESLLNRQSGLLGISGLTHDMRDLLDEVETHQDRRARLAIDIFAYRARKYIGAYLAAMGGADAVVLTGGIGENAPSVRRRILEGFEWAGLEIDDDANAAAVGSAGRISTDASRLHAWVIPTDEELLIARDTARLVLGLETKY